MSNVHIGDYVAQQMGSPGYRETDPALHAVYARVVAGRRQGITSLELDHEEQDTLLRFALVLLDSNQPPKASGPDLPHAAIQQYLYRKASLTRLIQRLMPARGAA